MHTEGLPGSSRPPAKEPYPLPLDFDRATLTQLQRSKENREALHPTPHVDKWIAAKVAAPCLQVVSTPLTELRKWRINKSTGNIEHESGMFFSITGVLVRHRTAKGVLNWDQPIIDQPEIGILGILAKPINGVLHFCLQAKEEPGNINSVQLSPTVQATYSNYTRVHGGNSPPFLEHFLSPPRERTLFAKLQTEDGGRFLYKSNRNMIVLLAEDEENELPPNFIWLTLHQISNLLKRDNLVHACTRSILAALLLPEGNNTSDRDDLAETVQWLDEQKAQNHFLAKREGLNTLKEWHLDKNGHFSHKERRFFQIIGIDVTSTGREVATWTQPILANPQSGIIGLLVRRKDGERQFLMQAKAELGNRIVVQLGPTVQFTPANYIGNTRLTRPFLYNEFSSPNRFSVLFQSHQAEEGARFFKESHLHRILELAQGEEIDIPADFKWIPESNLRFLLHLGEQVNSCARSVISCLLGGGHG